MRVDKKFTPITLIIETEEDKAFILEVLNKATRYYMSNGLFFSARKHQDVFPQKCEYLERLLK